MEVGSYTKIMDIQELNVFLMLIGWDLKTIGEQPLDIMSSQAKTWYHGKVRNKMLFLVLVWSQIIELWHNLYAKQYEFTNYCLRQTSVLQCQLNYDMIIKLHFTLHLIQYFMNELNILRWIVTSFVRKSKMGWCPQDM